MAKINADEYLLRIGYIQESVPLIRDWYESWQKIDWYFHLSQSLLLDVAVKQLNPNSGAHIIHYKDLFSIQNSSGIGTNFNSKKTEVSNKWNISAAITWHGEPLDQTFAKTDSGECYTNKQSNIHSHQGRIWPTIWPTIFRIFQSLRKKSQNDSEGVGLAFK